MAWGGTRPGAGRKSKPRKAAKRATKPTAPTPAPSPSRVPFQVIDGGQGVISEPDWSTFFADELDLAIAHEQWGVVLRELRDAEKLATANAHQIRRYVIFCVQFEVAARHVAEDGAVFPRKGKKQPAYNPWFSVMKDANAAAAAAEAELTVSPRRRNNGGKVQRKAKRTTASDEFLGLVASGPGNAVGKRRG